MLIRSLLRRHLLNTRWFSSGNDKVPVNIGMEDVTAEQLILREKELFERHTRLQKSFDRELPFFYKMYGTKDKIDEKTSFMPKRLMGYYGVQQSTLTQYFLKIFKGTLYATVARDNKFLDEYVEKSLAQRIRKDMEIMDRKHFTLSAVEERANQLLEFKDDAELVELALIRGLSVDREQNKPLEEYIKYTDDEEIGLTIYTPKHLSNPEAFIDPKTNKTIYDDYSTMLVMRVLARVRTSVRLKVKQLSIKNDMYTWEHLCIFQNQMVPPKKFTSSYKLETYLQWLSKFKFGVWKLADVDNCMLGNSLIRQGVQQDFKDDVFRKSKYDTKESIDIKQVDR